MKAGSMTVASIIAGLVACSGSGGHQPEPFEPTAATRAYCGERENAAIEARITTLLGELRLD
jgi:hypothetical protein